MSGLSEGLLAGRLLAEGFLAALFPIAFEVSLAIAFEVASFVFRAGRRDGTCGASQSHGDGGAGVGSRDPSLRRPQNFRFRGFHPQSGV